MNKFLSMLVFMICTNLATAFAQTTTLEVDNQYPGWLSSKIPFKDQASVQNLTVTGYINGTDVKFIRELINNRQLSHLDLSDANIVAGGEAYYVDPKVSYKIYKDNTIGSYMFATGYNSKLTYLSLPKSVTKINLDYYSDSGYINYCDDNLDTLVIGGDLKMLRAIDVRQPKKYLMIREGVDSLNAKIQAKSVHLPTTIKYLNRKTFLIDTVKANIENIDYFNNRCVYSGNSSNYNIGVLDNDTITLSENLSKWNVNAFRVKDGTTIFLNNKLKEINFDIDFGSSSTWNGGALSAKNLIIHSPSRTPIKINSKGLFSTATIYVPKGSVEAYKSQLPWSNATILEEKVPVTGIRFDKENIMFSEIGETALLRATVLPEDADNKNVRWESSNEKVATVENGIVTCKGYGTAEISATTEDGGFTAVCKVTAERKEILPTSITLDKADVTMNVGETTKLKADVWPTDADNKSVIWNSDNEDITPVRDKK